jgi:hypothetical protein
MWSNERFNSLAIKHTTCFARDDGTHAEELMRDPFKILVNHWHSGLSESIGITLAFPPQRQ